MKVDISPVGDTRSIVLIRDTSYSETGSVSVEQEYSKNTATIS